jgi:hypothetical protein
MRAVPITFGVATCGETKVSTSASARRDAAQSQASPEDSL